MNMPDVNDILKLIDSYCKFDKDQSSVSGYHDKQDLLSEIEKLFSKDKKNNRKKECYTCEMFGYQCNINRLFEDCK